MNSMDYQLDSGWLLHPIGGDTGQAYMGIREEEKVFLKRNSSPFLAALSLEGITPKLIWTKRIGNGDILTAQEWLNGRELYTEEMTSHAVIDLIRRFHRSHNLLKMLQKVKGEICTPENFLAAYEKDLVPELRTNSVLRQILYYLKDTSSQMGEVEYTVCHGDLNRRNFLLNDDERLYLVDWEMVKIADPISDVTMVLTSYVEPEYWGRWLNYYGIVYSDRMRQRLEWYTLYHTLCYVKKYHAQERYQEMNQAILRLKELFEEHLYLK